MFEISEASSLTSKEEKILQFWKKHHVFQASLNQTQKGKKFTFYDGPPFATGHPHYGHLLAGTIKERCKGFTWKDALVGIAMDFQ